MPASDASRAWRNASVVALFGPEDPVESIVRRARAAVLAALDAGWSGPPFDPFELAEILSIPTVPLEDMFDARTVVAEEGPVDSRGVRIEYNPNRPRGRLRFSLAHEIAHTLFPDVAEVARQRTGQGAVPRTDSSDWELELLCNVAAAELLMPAETLADVDLDEVALDVDVLMELRARYDVSTEALLRRVAALTRQSVLVVATARTEDRTDSLFRVDYAAPSRGWQGISVERGSLLPSVPPLADCSAVGFTARASLDNLAELKGPLSVQAVGAPPYPGHRLPRVLALVTQPADGVRHSQSIEYVSGDATEPRGERPSLIAHVVNDSARGFGGPFSRALTRRYPHLEETFRAWTIHDSANLTLGRTHIVQTERELWVASMVAQAGFGDSGEPRIRYQALAECLEEVSRRAENLGASVHFPRIGAGGAGGDWLVVAELIDETLCRSGISVTVYTLPGEHPDALERHRVQQIQPY